MGEVQINKLELGDGNPTLCIRVSRLWEYRDQNDESILHHIGLVLVDEKGSTIAALIYPPWDKKLEPLITEGKVYLLTYYRVKPCTKHYRPVDNKMSITFTRWTAIEEYVDVPDGFAHYAYLLTPYRVDRKDSFIDIIGVITDISSVMTVQTRIRDGDSLRRNVYIHDADNETTNIALWGEKATSFPTDELLNAGKEKPQVVIFVGTLVRGHGRNVSLLGNSACKWYINIDTPEVKSLAASIEGSYEPIKWLDLPSAPIVQNSGEQKTVAEIRELHPFKFKKHEFSVTVVTKKLNMEYSWWYTACDICKKTAKPCGNLYRYGNNTCPPVVSASPRFKLSVIAGDDTTNTTFVIFGPLAQRLIGRSVEELVLENPTSKDYIPKEITELLEKEFVWNVSFTENTVSSGIVAFQVNRVVKGAQSHSLALLQSLSRSQETSLMPSMPLSLVASQDLSIGQPTATASPLVGFTDNQLALISPSITTEKDEDINNECASKTPAQVVGDDEGCDVDDEHLSLTQKAPASGTKNNTSKAYKKRPRPSPGTGAAKKLFKDCVADDADDVAGGSAIRKA